MWIAITPVTPAGHRHRRAPLGALPHGRATCPAPRRCCPTPPPSHDVITEVGLSQLTERGATRADDRLCEAAMEDRKREGYF